MSRKRNIIFSLNKKNINCTSRATSLEKKSFVAEVTFKLNFYSMISICTVAIVVCNKKKFHTEDKNCCF